MQAKVSTLYSTLETKSERYRKVFNNFTSQSAGLSKIVPGCRENVVSIMKRKLNQKCHDAGKKVEFHTVDSVLTNIFCQDFESELCQN